MNSVLLSASCLTLLTLPGPSQAQSVPFFSAKSLQRGTVIKHSADTRVVGSFDTSTVSKTTEGIIGVQVQLRSFHKASPLEVQCFFVAKDSTKARYVYDFVRASSVQQFDELQMFGRDLFVGSEKVEKTRIEIQDLEVNGQTIPGPTELSLKLTTTTPGSVVEGWIVRVISEGKVVCLDASLQELKQFARRESAQLDKIASEIKGK